MRLSQILLSHPSKPVLTTLCLCCEGSVDNREQLQSTVTRKHFMCYNECFSPSNSGLPECPGHWMFDGSGDGVSFFKGEFHCNAVFLLSGPTMQKCRNLSGSMPACSVFGCDPKNLPNFVNGRRLRVKGTRDSVFKYKCNHGFTLFRPTYVYCTKNGWKMD